MNSHYFESSSKEANTSHNYNIFDYLPTEILLMIIANLDPQDFRLSRVNRRMYTLFHSEWYDNYWQRVSRQVWGECPSHSINEWIRYYRFRDRKDHSENMNHSRFIRMVRTGDQLGAMMLDLHAEDVGRELVRAHVSELRILLSHLYQIMLRDVFKNSDLNYKYDESHFYQLHYAVFCFESHWELEHLLKRGHHVDCRSVRGHTPLHIAAGSGQLKNVEMLIKYRANIKKASKQGDTPLSKALQHDHEDCVNALINAGASLNEFYQSETAFSHAFNAIKCRSISAIFCRIVSHNYIDMSLSIHEKIFMLCCQNGFTELVKAMIIKNINLQASISADTTIVKKQCEILQCKDRVLTLLGNNGEWYSPSMPGFTALDLAVLFDRLDIVKLITSTMAVDKLIDLLTSPHLNQRASTFQLALAVNRAEMICHLDNWLPSHATHFINRKLVA